MTQNPDVLAHPVAQRILPALDHTQRQHVAQGLDPNGDGDLVTWAGAALLGLVLRDLGTERRDALTLSRTKRGTVSFAFALQTACRESLYLKAPASSPRSPKAP